jgi:c-di-GMP phosphodiesterase
MTVVEPPMPPEPEPEAEPAEALLARQAIVDDGERVIGYEILYRGPRRSDGRPQSEADATSEVIWNAWMRLGQRETAGAVPIWLNVGADYLERTATLPVHPSDVVLELSELDRATPELVERVRVLRRDGYTVALDDYAPGGPGEPLLRYAHVVKLDVVELGVDGVIEAARELRGRGVSVVAEKVETRADFERLKAAGLLFFQGWFYEEAQPLRTRAVPLRAIESLRSAGALIAAGDDLDRIEAIVAEDAVLTFRLIRLANSGFYGMATPVETLRGALTRVGSRAAREWLTMALLHGVSDPSHPALAAGISRARLCATLAGDEDPELRDRCHLVGLLSVLDALLGPLDDVLAELRVGPRITDALLEHAGREGAILDWAKRLQRGAAPAGIADVAAAARATVEAEAYGALTLSSLQLAI